MSNNPGQDIDCNTASVGHPVRGPYGVLELVKGALQNQSWDTGAPSFMPDFHGYFKGLPLDTLHLKYGGSLPFQQFNMSIYGEHSLDNCAISISLD